MHRQQNAQGVKLAFSIETQAHQVYYQVFSPRVRAACVLPVESLRPHWASEKGEAAAAGPPLGPGGAGQQS